MAFEQKKTLRGVRVLYKKNETDTDGQEVAYGFEVEWRKRGVLDGADVYDTPHCCAYTEGQKAQFEADLGQRAAEYLSKVNWEN